MDRGNDQSIGVPHRCGLSLLFSTRKCPDIADPGSALQLFGNRRALLYDDDRDVIPTAAEISVQNRGNDCGVSTMQPRIWRQVPLGTQTIGCHDDYTTGGHRVIELLDTGGRVTRSAIVRNHMPACSCSFAKTSSAALVASCA